MMDTIARQEQQEEIKFWAEMEEPLDSLEVVVTHHAGDRIKERIGGSKHTVERMAKKALVLGISEQSASGQLKRYIAKKRLKKGMADNIRIYHQHVYLFANSILITVFRLPNRFLKIEEKIKHRLQNAT